MAIKGFVAAILIGALVALGWWFSRDTDPQPGQAFRDRAEEAGIDFRMSFLPTEQGANFKINLYDHGCGLAVADVNGDGHDDVYFLNQLGPNALYQNRGDGTFSPTTETAGVALEDRVCVSATFADYDNDGDQDLFVTSTRGGNVLFENDGAGVFTDVTEDAGVTHIGHSQTAAFFDYDNDGLLDLLVLNSAEWTTDNQDDSSLYYLGKGDGPEGIVGLAKSDKESNILYHNEGDGKFSDVTEESGLIGLGWGGDLAVFDYDLDGRLDVFVTSMFGRDQLYHNDGEGVFTDVTLDVLGRTSWGSIGAKVFDADGDGRLDLMIADMHSDMWMGLDANKSSLMQAVENQARKFKFSGGPYAENFPPMQAQEKEFAKILGYKHEEVVFGNTLFRARGDGTFEEVSDSARLETFWPWGIGVGDFDNDGDQDVFLPSGMGHPFYYWANEFLVNGGNGVFTNQAKRVGIEPPKDGIQLDPIGEQESVRSSRCVVTSDFDGDGRLDMVVNNFNHEPYYFVNQYRQRDYVALRLQGRVSNRDAIGARVTVRTDKGTLVRQVHASGGYLSHSSKTLHFGLGDAAIERVDIVWPSGRKETREDVEPNQLHEIVEPE